MTTTTTCARSQCSDAPTESVAGRCLACRVVGEQIVCASHREELTCGMLLGLVRSRCCDAMVTLVRVVPL